MCVLKTWLDVVLCEWRILMFSRWAWLYLCQQKFNVFPDFPQMNILSLIFIRFYHFFHSVFEVFLFSTKTTKVKFAWSKWNTNPRVVKINYAHLFFNISSSYSFICILAYKSHEIKVSIQFQKYCMRIDVLWKVEVKKMEFLWPELMDIDLEDIWFQQDGWWMTQWIYWDNHFLDELSPEATLLN